ncbi:hypothetical protein [Gordoniibacillus kamchatkensis]|uniref:hypothetical protein n=1 Tax=Gordoniibacillus kamchatkensis TaxID=1590651 RepID=UPI000698DE4F|nr:hypothetical protein [Paenibacillus sp. VKM B-2647]
MANRKNRKQRYNEAVSGKIGGIDLVHASNDNDHIINARGGKVYHDITKHSFLEIPDSMEGKVYEVLSVGLQKEGHPIVTVQVGDLVQVYRLPQDYVNWINHLREASVMGIKMLPAKVEFGKRSDGSYYAEIL